MKKTKRTEVLRIRREHAAGKAIEAIMRDLHLSRGVVRGAFRVPEADIRYRREVQPLPKPGPFRMRPNALLEDDEARPRPGGASCPDLPRRSSTHRRSSWWRRG